MKKIYALFVLFSFFCMCGAMDIPTFNKGTAPGDWKDDFPLANKGKFELTDGKIKLTLTGPSQCSRYKCSIDGMRGGSLMYFSFYCDGKNIQSAKEGFRSYLRSKLPRSTASFSPAGNWKWAKGTFDKVLVEGRFKVPADGKLEVVFELRGDAGEVNIYAPMITATKRKDALDKSPVKVTVLPVMWLKDTSNLVQNMPTMVKVNFRADGRKFAGKKLDFTVEHPDFVELIGVEYKQPVRKNGKLHYPALQICKKKPGSVVFRLPEQMVKALKQDSVLWNNELYVFFNTQSQAGKKGKITFKLTEGKNELAAYNFTAKTCGPLPANRKAAKDFKTVIGYPVTAESPFAVIRQAYADFWKSLAKNNEAYSPVWFDQLADELQKDFRKNYTAGIMIAGTGSIPLFRVMKLDGKYPHLKDNAGNVMKNGRNPLPSIKYVLDDPDNFIWGKVFKDEVKYRTLALPDTKFICYDFEPHLMDTGYCDDNLKWFAKWAKLSTVPTPKDVYYKYAVKWASFRRYQSELLFQKFAAAVKKHFPELEFRYCSDPLSASGSVSSWCANDPRQSVKHVEVFHNMPYFGGSEYFDVIKANTEILGKKQYPLIDPSEFSEQFFRKYSDLKTSQNILATAALNNIGIGFWHRECFDGRYLIEMARAFAAVAEVEELYGQKNVAKDFKVTAENCLKKTLGKNAVLEYPKFTDKLRFTAHRKNNSAVVTVFNYDSREKIIVKCQFPALKAGTYTVTDVFNRQSYGNFSATELKKGILLSINPDGAAVMKAVPATGKTAAVVSQAQLRQTVRETIAKLSKQQSFNDIVKGDCRIRWAIPEGRKNTAIILSCGKMSIAIDPEKGDVVSLPGTPIQQFGDVILENAGLEKPLKYQQIFAGVKDGKAVISFRADVRKEDSTNPGGFKFDGLRIVKTYSVSEKDVKFSISFENRNVENEKFVFRARVRSMLSPVRVKEIPAGLATEILMKKGEKINLPWAMRPKKTPWNGKIVTFADKMQYQFDGSFAGVYFWQSATLITAEPFTPLFELKAKSKKDFTVTVKKQ